MLLNVNRQSAPSWGRSFSIKSYLYRIDFEMLHWADIFLKICEAVSRKMETLSNELETGFLPSLLLY